jgi:hypothetical protein
MISPTVLQEGHDVATLTRKKALIDPDRLRDHKILSTNPEWQQVPDDYIRVRAYYLWEEAGRPECDGCEFWSKAESELCSGKG